MAQQLDIAICTFAPDRQVLKRLCDAMSALRIPADWRVSLTLVDNNSPEPVASYQEVEALLALFAGSQLIVETRQGVGFARQAAIAHTSAPWLLFFDDDNEPAPDYLEQMVQLFGQYPNVGIWGAGHIVVGFVGDLEDPYVRNYLSFYGQKSRQHVEYACLPSGWLSCYPPAMGSAMRRDVLSAYLEEARIGKLTAPGRTGRRVFAGEDTQMVFQAVKMGYAVGMAPALKMSHLIAPRKTSLAYIIELGYGNSVSYAKAYFECFGYHIPEMAEPGTWPIIEAIFGRLWHAFWTRRYRSAKIELARYLGQTEGNYWALGKPTPWPLHRLKSILKID